MTTNDDQIGLAAARIAMALTPGEAAALGALRGRIARVVFPTNYHQAEPADMLLFALEALVDQDGGDQGEQRR